MGIQHDKIFSGFPPKSSDLLGLRHHDTLRVYS